MCILYPVLFLSLNFFDSSFLFLKKATSAWGSSLSCGLFSNIASISSLSSSCLFALQAALSSAWWSASFLTSHISNGTSCSLDIVVANHSTGSFLLRMRSLYAFCCSFYRVGQSPPVTARCPALSYKPQ